METSLHRELKARYAIGDARQEVRLGHYRIDVVTDDTLIEIQHGSLAAIRRKVADLVTDHAVLVVKPIIASKLLVHHRRRGGKIMRRRMSPKRGTRLDVFHDLIYFTRTFPHERLTLELVLVDIEEDRYPGHGRRRRWRADDFQVADQRLLTVNETFRLHTADDLRRLLNVALPSPFHTGDLAKALGIERWWAQRIAYCLRHMGAAIEVGKRRGARLYAWPPQEAPRAAPTRKRSRAA